MIRPLWCEKRYIGIKDVTSAFGDGAIIGGLRHKNVLALILFSAAIVLEPTGFHQPTKSRFHITFIFSSRTGDAYRVQPLCLLQNINLNFIESWCRRCVRG